MGVSVFGRAAGLIEEADRKYSNICWEYEAKQTAVHISQSLLARNDAGKPSVSGRQGTVVSCVDIQHRGNG